MNPSFQLIDAGWDSVIGNAVALSCSELRLVSPFIKLRAAKRLLKNNPPELIQVITRFHPGEMCAGVNDTEALRLLLECGAKIRGIRGLHAKVYLFGNQRAVVTSANLTESALLRNHEFGFVSSDDHIIKGCRAYFDQLWQHAGSDLELARLEGWEKKIAAIRLAGTPPSPSAGLKDEGADVGLPPSEIVVTTESGDVPNAYVKFFGKGDSRATHDLRVIDEVSDSGSHWACTYPANKRPRSVRDGDVMFMARLVENPHDIIIYGRAIGLRHVDGRDEATRAEIDDRTWKEDWPAYVRVHSAEFVAGTLKNGVSLSALMGELESDAFASTQRNAHGDGDDNKDPRRALMRKAHMQLTKESFAWLDRKLREAFETHGKLTPAELETLDWPKVKFVNTSVLPANGRRLLQALVEKLDSAALDVSRPVTFPSYKDILIAIGLEPWVGARLGPQFSREGGEALNNWLRENNLPALTGLVVNRDSSRPGGDYFRSNGRPEEDFNWWLEQMRQSKTFDWKPYLDE